MRDLRASIIGSNIKYVEIIDLLYSSKDDLNKFNRDFNIIFNNDLSEKLDAYLKLSDKYTFDKQGKPVKIDDEY